MSLDLVLGPPQTATGDEAENDGGGGAEMPLDVLFTCARFGPLTHGACRRRQLELRLVEDPKKPGTKRPGPPTYAFCASGECVTGTAIAAALEAEDVSSATCPKCGTAYVGPEAQAFGDELARLAREERAAMLRLEAKWPAWFRNAESFSTKDAVDRGEFARPS